MGASKNSTTKPLTRYFTPHSVDFKCFLEKFSKILAKNSQFRNFFSANKKKMPVTQNLRTGNFLEWMKNLTFQCVS